MPSSVGIRYRQARRHLLRSPYADHAPPEWEDRPYPDATEEAAQAPPGEMMQIIWTIRSQLESGHQLEPWCPSCQKHLPPVDLLALVRRGHGEQNIRELGLRHDTCGTELLFTLRPPSRHRPADPKLSLANS